jgi:arylsulfatase A
LDGTPVLDVKPSVPYADALPGAGSGFTTVGQVMEAIRKSGAAENTIVLFTSDNGPENLTYPVLQEFGHASQGPLRGAKRMLWEGGHRVPFVAWGPGRVPAGKVEKEIICLTDLMAPCAGDTGGAGSLGA